VGSRSPLPVVNIAIPVTIAAKVIGQSSASRRYYLLRRTVV
jgi:hypothetical protein